MPGETRNINAFDVRFTSDRAMHIVFHCKMIPLKKREEKKERKVKKYIYRGISSQQVYLNKEALGNIVVFKCIEFRSLLFKDYHGCQL